jgi:hypothetical protein
VIAIVDYGRGNLGSVEKAFARIGMPAVVTQDPKVVDDAEAVVLPGDGAFHDAMGSLQALGLIAPLRACFTRIGRQHSRRAHARWFPTAPTCAHSPSGGATSIPGTPRGG